MNREAIFAALFNLLSGVAGAVVVTRRLKVWTDFTPTQKPCICISERDQDYKRDSEAAPAVITLAADLFIYIRTQDSNAVPAIVMNGLLDAIDTALRPDNMVTGLLTLGGLVSHCWIDGRTMVETGDMDGDGIAVVPVKMLLPA